MPHVLVLAAAESPTLDLNALEKRLVDTKALGFLSKLSLKGKLDTFVKDLRAAHSGSGLSLEEARERYDLLMHTVLTMVEKGDAELARDLAAAREPLWKLLADVERFEKLAGDLA